MTAQRKKIYLLILGLAVVGFLVDRFILSSPVTGPSKASGDVLSGLDDPSAPSEARPDHAGIPELPFPGVLERYSMTPIPDLFAAPRAHAQDEGSKGATARADAGKPPSVDIGPMLQGVFVAGDVRYAVVGGKALKLGESMMGCTLLGISGTRVKFLCADGEVIATVPTSVGTRSN